MKKGYCHIDRKVYTINFPGGCTLPAETFLRFKRNVWFLENVMFLLYKYGDRFSFIFKLFMEKGYCHIDRKVYTINFPGGCTLPAETFLRFKGNLCFLESVMFLSTPFRLCRRALRGFFFGKNSVPNKNKAYVLKKWRIIVFCCYFCQYWLKFEA